MNSNQHLDAEQLANATMEDESAHAAHLRECPQCAGKATGLRASLSEFGSFVREAGEQPNTYWWRQRNGEPVRSFPLMQWASAAVIALAVAFTVPFLHFTKVVAPPPAHKVQVSDEALLSEVETDIEREYPDALAPVGTNAAVTQVEYQKVTNRKGHRTK